MKVEIDCSVVVLGFGSVADGSEVAVSEAVVPSMAVPLMAVPLMAVPPTTVPPTTVPLNIVLEVAPPGDVLMLAEARDTGETGWEIEVAMRLLAELASEDELTIGSGTEGWTVAG